MKQLIFWTMGIVTALVLFVGLVVMFLVIQGRADDISLANLLNRKPPAEKEKLPEDATKTPAATATPEAPLPPPLNADEVQALIDDLKHEKEKVAKQAAQLDADRQEIDRQKVDLTMREQEVARILSEISLKMDHGEGGMRSGGPPDEELLKSLATEYSGMDVKKASAILKAMKDQGMAVQILGHMKSKTRAKVLESLDSETAAHYAEELRLPKASQPEQTAGQDGTAGKK